MKYKVKEFSKNNSYYRKDTPSKKIHENINSLAPLLLNTENEYLKEIADKVFADYDVTIKFIFRSSPLSEDIIVSSMRICRRDDKFGPVKFGKGVKLIEGTPTSMGGSNRHPRPTFEEGYCILQFKCPGLPILDECNWDFEIIELNRVGIQEK